MSTITSISMTKPIKALYGFLARIIGPIHGAQSPRILRLDMMQVIGIAILLVGVGLLGLAYHSTIAPMKDMSSETGDFYSYLTIWSFLVGITAVVSGGVLALIEYRK